MSWCKPSNFRIFHDVPEKLVVNIAVFRAAAEALPLQARHGDSACAVGRDQDLQLRSAPPTRADDSAADAAAQRCSRLEHDVEDGLEALPPACALDALRQQITCSFGAPMHGIDPFPACFLSSRCHVTSL